MLAQPMGIKNSLITYVFVWISIFMTIVSCIIINSRDFIFAPQRDAKICKKLLLFDSVPNKKFIHGLLGLEQAPNDAPSHRDGSQQNHPSRSNVKVIYI